MLQGVLDTWRVALVVSVDMCLGRCFKSCSRASLSDFLLVFSTLAVTLPLYLKMAKSVSILTGNSERFPQVKAHHVTFFQE